MVAHLSLTLATGIDYCIHRKSDFERVCLKFLGIKLDANRQTLYHLDPVACGILCRNGGKCRTRSTREAGDDTVVSHVLAVNVGVQLDGLTGFDFFQLHFFKVGERD